MCALRQANKHKFSLKEIQQIADIMKGLKKSAKKKCTVPIKHKTQYRGEEYTKRSTHAVGRRTIARHYNGSSEIGKVDKSRIQIFDTSKENIPRAREDRTYKEPETGCNNCM